MAFQSPLIAIPRKTTQDVDWTGPIRHIIAASYGEDPNSYAEECSVLQRCRQDAVRGAGSDYTARDLLYKYFGQLELLELRFAEIKVSFAWNDALTTKLTTQTSLAFEKASIIHLISSILSSVAQTSARSDPEGLKRAYYNTRAAAGMLTYINENFLHAPSTDLSREVVHLLIGVMMAQATEIFSEKLIDEKKSPALIARSANQTGILYTTVVDELKEFQGKGVFDRNWLYVLQIKSKLFGSLAQYYKAVAENAAGKHGSGLVRLKVADSLVQESLRQATSFSYTFASGSTPSLPHDAATSLLEIVKAHAAVCKEAKDQAVKDNDLIYHEVLPLEASLPAIEKLPPAAPITIQEVYGNPEVTKLIGPDIFLRLVPLAVHESASVYSEEKAKLVRAEVERAELSEIEIKTGLEHLNLPNEMEKWSKLLDDDNGGHIDLSSELKGLVDTVGDTREIESDLRDLTSEREGTERALRDLGSTLDNESRECERMRAKYSPNFTQSPSGPLTTNLRSNIAANLSALSSAAASDGQLQSIWRSIQPSISILSSGLGNLERVAQGAAEGKTKKVDNGISLLDIEEDLGQKSALGPEEICTLQTAVGECGEKLGRLGKIRKERDEVLKDLKEKIQNDDVSNLLLLNRRSQNVEPQLFASELEKFRPYQTRLAAAMSASKSVLQELEMLVLQVQKGKGLREISRTEKDKSRRVRDWESTLIEAGKSYAEVQAGLSKGLAYYSSLQGVIEHLTLEVKGLVAAREQERSRLVGEAEARQRLNSVSPGASAGSRGLEERLAALSVAPPPQPPRPSASSSTPSLPTPPHQTSTPFYPPPPPPIRSDHSSPYDFSNLTGLSAFSSSSSSATLSQQTEPASQSQRHGSYGYGAYTSPAASQPPTQGTSNPYPPPPPSRPATQSYPSYGNQAPTHSPYPAPPSQPSYTSLPPSHSSYPSAPSQQYHSAPPPQPSYGGQAQGSQQYSSYQSQGQGHGYHPQPGLNYASAPPLPQQQPQVQGHSSYQPPSGYQAQQTQVPQQQQQQPPQGQSYGHPQYGYQNGPGQAGYGQYP